MWDKLNEKYDIVLASASPRRQQLLAEMGISFRVETYPVEEAIEPGLSPRDAAQRLSELKAKSFPENKIETGTLVITADTIVVLDNQILGKPAGPNEAITMLENLSGKRHEVITGVSLRTIRHLHSFSAVTAVYFKQLSPEEINFYVNRFKPFDKAGAYGIQEWIGHAAVEKIEGSYFNVMGLPTHKLYRELLRLMK